MDLNIFFAVWISLLWVIGLICGTVFLRRRLVQPLKVRMPRLTLCACVLLLVCISLLPLQRFPEYSGGLLALHYVVLLGSVCSILLVRLWIFLFAFGVGHERATNAGTGWFLRHRKMASSSARIIIFGCLLLLQLVIFVALAVALPESWGLPVRNDPKRFVIDCISSVLVIIYSLVLLVSATKLRTWAPSTFFLAQEHAFLGILSLSFAIAYLVLILQKDFMTAQIVIVIGCGMVIKVLLIYPLIKMFRFTNHGNLFFSFSSSPVALPPPFSFRRALSPKAFDDLNLDSPPDTLLAFLSNKTNKKLFSDFLALEFSLENLQFLDAIENYKAEFLHSTNLLLCLNAAKKIFTQFLAEGSESQVSVASNMNRVTTNAIVEATKKVEIGDMSALPDLICLFDNAGKLVFKHLSSDAFPRFLQSPVFTELQEEREFAPLLFAPGVRPWTSWIASSSTVASKEERERLRLEAKRTSRQMSDSQPPERNKLSALQT